ncbi:hypothetical protein CDAR_274441 [Caerostris darwini]|uniref:Uncharacterized protein n=1 Tax=Caerostris darwini TaxID=1538125 RepID=A0AAV4RDV5_9ARAC|nr:hypothetical protein CDAR_274441 [Caerostris darwini]
MVNSTSPESVNDNITQTKRHLNPLLQATLLQSVCPRQMKPPPLSDDSSVPPEHCAQVRSHIGVSAPQSNRSGFSFILPLLLSLGAQKSLGQCQTTLHSLSLMHRRPPSLPTGSSCWTASHFTDEKEDLETALVVVLMNFYL